MSAKQPRTQNPSPHRRWNHTVRSTVIWNIKEALGLRQRSEYPWYYRCNASCLETTHLLESCGERTGHLAQGLFFWVKFLICDILLKTIQNVILNIFLPQRSIKQSEFNQEHDKRYYRTSSWWVSHNFFTVNYWNEISRLNLHIRPLSQLGKRGERRTNLMELMFSFSKETFPFISFII